MKNIEFSPSVFDDRKAERVEPIEPIQPIERSSFNWWPWVISSVLVLALGDFAAYLISTKPGVMSEPVAFSSGIRPILESASITTTPLSMGQRVESDVQKGDCKGDEIICTVATASKPVELLHKIVSAIPISGAKQYRVRLSVTPIEEPAGDTPAGSTP